MSRRLLIEHSRVVGIVVICLVLALVAPEFLQGRNLVNVVRQSSLTVALATGLTMTLLVGGIDLSVASVLAMSGVLMGALMTGGVAWPLAILAGVGAATAAGAVNGVMVAYVRIPAFVATYGMLWIAQGLAIFLSGSQIFFGFPESFVFLGQGWVLGIPSPVIVTTALVAVTWVLLRLTRLGRSIYAMGSNARAAHRYGIPRKRNLMFVYTASGGCAGIAAVLFTARLNAASAEFSILLLLPTLAAVVIGGTSLFGGVGGIVHTVLGALIMNVIINGMNLLNVQSFLQLSVIGVLVITAVLFDRWVPKAVPVSVPLAVPADGGAGGRQAGRQRGAVEGLEGWEEAVAGATGGSARKTGGTKNGG